MKSNKGTIICKRADQKQIKSNTGKLESKNKVSGLFSILAFLHPPGDKTNGVSNFAWYLHQTKTNEIDPAFGLELEGIETLEELNNLKLNLFHLIEKNVDPTISIKKNVNNNNKGKSMKTSLRTIKRITLMKSTRATMRKIKQIIKKMTLIESMNCTFKNIDN